VNTNIAFLASPSGGVAMYNSNGSLPILMHLSLADFTAGMSRGAPHDPGGQQDVMIEVIMLCWYYN
jgi:hypothetical protein